MRQSQADQDTAGLLSSALRSPDIEGERSEKSETSENRESFYSSLHYATAISLIVLVVCGYRMSQADAQRVSQSRSMLSTAFVYLASSEPKDLRNLAFSLRSLDENYNSNAGHRVIIAHESISLAAQNELQNNSTSHLEFREVSIKLPEVLYDHYNLSSIDPPFSKREKWSYQNMCRFWFTGIMDDTKKSPFVDIDILIRLDTDSAFSMGELDRNFVADFIGGRRRYGYLRVEKECDTDGKDLARSLRQMATTYVDLNSIHPKSLDLWSQVLRQKGSCIPSFASHFEIIDLRFWRTHQGLLDWRDVVEKNGGIYTHGWGDGQLRFMAAAMHLGPSELVHIPKSRLFYQHPHNMGKQNTTLNNTLQ